MRKGLFLSAMLASLFVTGAAMADRNGDNETNSKFSRGQQIKEQVLDKQREVKTRAVREATTRARGNKALDQRMARMRPHGDVYGVRRPGLAQHHQVGRGDRGQEPERDQLGQHAA